MDARNGGADATTTNRGDLSQGDTPIKRNISEGVIRQWKYRSEQRPGAILLYGPPGTGKTTIAKVIAKQLNQDLGSLALETARDQQWRFLEFTPADFARGGTDHVVANAEHIFSQLCQVRRCVVLLDEMEEFLRARGPESDRDSRLVTTAFLPLLQEAVRSREIILVVATNFVGTIDPAVTRRGRFDLILPLGPPDRQSRVMILKNIGGYEEFRRALARRIHASEEEVDGLIVKYTMGYTGPEIEDFIRELRRFIRDAEAVGSQARLHPTAMGRAGLIMNLWRIRQERVPTALSGRIGSSWRAFADEARRYARYAIGLDRLAAADEDPSHRIEIDDGSVEGDDYWSEPGLPSWSERLEPA